MEQAILSTQRFHSAEEYLGFEESSQNKHELRDGEIFAMAGASPVHAGISANLLIEIGVRLRGKPCRVFGSDLRIRINKSGNFSYPDLSVVCGPLDISPSDAMTVANPTVLIEVTSPTTETKDRGAKFTDYRNIESLREYFLVSQIKPALETFYRQPDGIWAIGPTVTGLDKAVKLRSLEMEIPLAEIYAGVELSAEVPGNAAEQQ